jgi:hypothetical protein
VVRVNFKYIAGAGAAVVLLAACGEVDQQTAEASATSATSPATTSTSASPTSSAFTADETAYFQAVLDGTSSVAGEWSLNNVDKIVQLGHDSCDGRSADQLTSEIAADPSFDGLQAGAIILAYGIELAADMRLC